MSLGTFVLGETIRIPLQIVEGGIPVSDAESVSVSKIFTKDNEEVSGFPASMTTLSSAYGVYCYDYKPESVGSYIVIMSFLVGSTEYSTIESFSVRKYAPGFSPSAQTIIDAGTVTLTAKSSSSSSSSSSASSSSSSSSKAVYAKAVESDTEVVSAKAVESDSETVSAKPK